MRHFSERLDFPILLFIGIWLLFFPAIVLHAQQKSFLRGMITDASDGSPLVAASVKVKNNFSMGTISDEEGRFSIQLDPGTYTFIISFIGMESETITLPLEPGESIEKQFHLKPLWQEIDEVEVKVSKFDRPIEEITVSMHVLKPILIESKNTRSIETVLDHTPGLNIMDGEPQIRGGSGFTFGVGSKVAVLIDGCHSDSISNIETGSFCQWGGCSRWLGSLRWQGSHQRWDLRRADLWSAS